jgi:hypothetical protein
MNEMGADGTGNEDESCEMCGLVLPQSECETSQRRSVWGRLGVQFEFHSSCFRMQDNSVTVGAAEESLFQSAEGQDIFVFSGRGAHPVSHPVGSFVGTLSYISR